jgi:hypothetical protein
MEILDFIGKNSHDCLLFGELGSSGSIVSGYGLDDQAI